MNVHLHTNLDEAQFDLSCVSWPDGEPPPRVGEYVKLYIDPAHSRNHYELQVSSVRYDLINQSVAVELHIPSYRGGSIQDWVDWIKRFRERTQEEIASRWQR